MQLQGNITIEGPERILPFSMVIILLSVYAIDRKGKGKSEEPTKENARCMCAMYFEESK